MQADKKKKKNILVVAIILVLGKGIRFVWATVIAVILFALWRLLISLANF